MPNQIAAKSATDYHRVKVANGRDSSYHSCVFPAFGTPEPLDSYSWHSYFGSAAGTRSICSFDLFQTIMEAIRNFLSEVKLEAVAHRNTQMLKTVQESATVADAIKVRMIIARPDFEQHARYTL